MRRARPDKKAADAAAANGGRGGGEAWCDSPAAAALMPPERFSRGGELAEGAASPGAHCAGGIARVSAAPLSGQTRRPCARRRSGGNRPYRSPRPPRSARRPCTRRPPGCPTRNLPTGGREMYESSSGMRKTRREPRTAGRWRGGPAAAAATRRGAASRGLGGGLCAPYRARRRAASRPCTRASACSGCGLTALTRPKSLPAAGRSRRRPPENMRSGRSATAASPVRPACQSLMPRPAGRRHAAGQAT